MILGIKFRASVSISNNIAEGFVRYLDNIISLPTF